MTVEELKDFLDYCDPEASIVITDHENNKSHTVLEEDVDYIVSKKTCKNRYLSMTVKELNHYLE